MKSQMLKQRTKYPVIDTNQTMNTDISVDEDQNAIASLTNSTIKIKNFIQNNQNDFFQKRNQDAAKSRSSKLQIEENKILEP